MIRVFAFSLLLVAAHACSSAAQQKFDLPSSIGSTPTEQAGYNAWFTGPGAYEPSSAYAPYSQPYAEPYSPSNWLQEAEKAGQAGGAAGEAEKTPEHGSTGSGSGAAAAVNPSAPLSQLQFQNVFEPESYGGSGYANQFIVQPVIAVVNKPDTFLGDLFPFHIIRPTLPILAPTSDPDGPVSDIGGLGDTTYFDLWIHPIKGQKGNNIAIGPVIVFPTSTSRQLGAGEWQLGPAFAYINTKRFKGWTIGALFEAPFSLESDIYSITVQPIVTKLLKNEWFAGVGDLAMKFDDQDGNYNIPLSLQLGKVVTAGKQPFKVFVQPQYTPRGLTSQDTAKYGVKLSVSLLMGGANFGYSKEKEEKRQNRRCHNRDCRGCSYCRY